MNLGYTNSPRCKLVKHQLERRKIELLVQTASPGLHQYRKVLVPCNRLEELPGTHPRNPERHALLECPAGKQERPSGTLAEQSAEESAVFQTAAKQELELVGCNQLPVCQKGLDCIGKIRDHQHDALVIRECLDEYARLPPPCLGKGKRERMIHPPAPESVEDDPLPGDIPRVAIPFHEHVVAVRERAAGRMTLTLQQFDEFAGSLSVHVVERADLFYRIRAIVGELRAIEFAVPLLEELEYPFACGEITVHRLGLPEGNGACALRPWYHLDVPVSYAGNLPRLRPERYEIPHPPFPHKLFIELANANPTIGKVPSTCASVEPQIERATVGDGPSGTVQEHADAVGGGSPICKSINPDARGKFAYSSVRVSSGEHLYDQVVLPA